MAAGVPILSDVELLFQAVRASGSQARFAGITGTNGKSTTTALLAHILETAGLPVAAGANLGPAALVAAAAATSMECTCWKCPPTCWSDSQRCDSMPLRCSTSARITSTGMATWPATPWRSARSSIARPTEDLAVIGMDDCRVAMAMADWLAEAPAGPMVVRDAPATTGPLPLGSGAAGQAQCAERRRRHRAWRASWACSTPTSRRRC